MNQTSKEILYTELVVFLRKLQIQDSNIQKKICDNLLSSLHNQLNDLSQDACLNILHNVAQHYFDAALEKFINKLLMANSGPDLNNSQTPIIHYPNLLAWKEALLTGTRAYLLAKQHCTDFLFSDAYTAPAIPFLLATPPESTLEVKQQAVDFPFLSLIERTVS